MDPQLIGLLMQMFGGGGGQGGGAVPGAMPPTAGVPNVPGSAAGQGVGPAVAPMPPMDATTGMSTGAPTMPSPAPMSARPPVNYGDPTQTMGSLGEALMPRPDPTAPMPMPRPPGLGAPAAPSPGYYGGSPETNPNLKPTAGAGGQTQRGPMDITKLLGGIKAPAGPDVVKPSTPSAPQTRAPGASNLIQLLMALGQGGKSLRGPTTLGQALDNRPAAWGGLYG